MFFIKKRGKKRGKYSIKIMWGKRGKD